MINVFQPILGVEELAAVSKVFDSNWIGKGGLTKKFEACFASHADVALEHMRSTNSCTEGMFQIIELLGLGPGDEVILPTINFVGAGNAVAASGATPVFCDTDPRTLNARASDIEAAITAKTRAVLLLHYGGLPCEMDDILALLESRKIPLIEDSACSVASRYRGRLCGTLGQFGVWSFDAMKILVTGDGGMVYCDDIAQAERLERRFSLGLDSQSGLSNSNGERWWEFQIDCFGRRCQMNDIAATIGLEQLNKLRDFTARRRAIHQAYDEHLADLDWVTSPPATPAHMESSHYFYWIQTPKAQRDGLARFLREHEIYTTFRYYPLHWVERYGSSVRLPQAEHAAESTLCLPMHQALSDGDIDEVVSRIREFGASCGL